MLWVTELVVRVMRVAGVAVAGRNDNGIVLSGKSLENWFWLCGWDRRRSMANNRLGCVHATFVGGRSSKKP
jgi:hypothetical protein